MFLPANVTKYAAAFMQAASSGVSTRGSALYITSTPCSICAKMIINAGIEEVVIESEYPDKMAIEFLEEAGVALRKINLKGSL